MDANVPRLVQKHTNCKKGGVAPFFCEQNTGFEVFRFTVNRIEPHTIVELSYELREDGPSGGLLELMDAKYPMKFYYGNGSLLPALEKKLEGMREGQSFNLTISPAEAYGELDPSLIVEMSLASFQNHPWIDRDNLTIGDRLAIQDEDTGKQKHGLITEVLAESILVDFNHAMAGKTLYFSGTVLHIRPPRADERTVQHYIESSGAYFS